MLPKEMGAVGVGRMGPKEHFFRPPLGCGFPMLVRQDIRGDKEMDFLGEAGGSAWAPEEAAVTLKGQF